MKKTNVITAAIDRLGGGSTGVKRVGVLLDLTTQRVYQLADRGLVRKAEHAAALSEATGIPFEAFLIRDRWQPDPEPPTGTDDDAPEGRKPPKESPPLTLVPSVASATGGEAPATTARLGRRVGCVIRPAKSASRHDATPPSCWSRSATGRSVAPRFREAISLRACGDSHGVEQLRARQG
jgi:hypothetical protein